MPLEIKRIFDFAYFQQEEYDLKKAMVSKASGEWVPTSSREFIEKANMASCGLLALGVKPGDRVALISSTNRTEWNIMDQAILQIGAVNVPIYPTISKEDYQYIFTHSESKYCFVSDKELLDKAVAVQPEVKTLKGIYCFEEVKGSEHWEKIFTLGATDGMSEKLEKFRNGVKPDDLATIIYTSGTTGVPKGVMLSHNNIVSNVLDCVDRLPLVKGESTVLSFLPVCHVFERMLHYLYIYCGLTINYAESIEKIGDNIREVQPNFMSVVPRLLEKVYDGIIAKGAELTGIKKKLFFWAVEVGMLYEPYGRNGWYYEKKLAFANKLIFSKWREALGGRLSCMVSGSAALQPRLARIFAAAQMHVMEGYGLTETSPVVSVNMYEGGLYKIGTVGTAIPNVEVKIADDGEILVKGPNVMQGYYKDPERTAEVMSGDYFHTGDKGEFDKEGFLLITGRKKEIFKTSGGKYISPILLENQMKQSRFIEQILVVGEGQKMPAALVQPNFEFVKEWARRHDVECGENLEEIASNKDVLKRIMEEIDHGNSFFGKWETIKKIEITPEVWSVDNDLLTPTFKPKREVILKKYQHLYDRIYS
jgi:long-chain acyl-CoA synthetase